jgi:hypothetical protein
MSDSDMTALVQQLQKSNRRWRRLAISLLVIIGLTLPLVTIAAAVLRVQAERHAREAQIAAEQARDQAEQARRQEEKVKNAMEAVEEFLKKGLNP